MLINEAIFTSLEIKRFIQIKMQALTIVKLVALVGIGVVPCHLWRVQPIHPAPKEWLRQRTKNRSYGTHLSECH